MPRALVLEILCSVTCEFVAVRNSDFTAYCSVLSLGSRVYLGKRCA